MYYYKSQLQLFFLLNQLFCTWEDTSFGILHLFTFAGCGCFWGFISYLFFLTLCWTCSFPFFCSIFLSWHFLVPEMGLNRHVLFSFPLTLYKCISILCCLSILCLFTGLAILITGIDKKKILIRLHCMVDSLKCNNLYIFI